MTYRLSLWLAKVCLTIFYGDVRRRNAHQAPADETA
jgi:hypothetical protein